MLRIDSWEINCFLVAASCRSFNAAAKRLSVSQPTVTRAITSLENELGVTLFERTPMGTSLSEAGALIRDFFVKQTDELDVVVEKARLIQNNLVGNLTLGFLEGQMIHPALREAIILFQQSYPHVKLSLHRDDYNQLYDGILTGKLDFIELPLRTFSSEELRTMPLYTYETFVCIPDTCAAYNKDPLVFTDLLSETLLYFNKDSRQFDRFTTKWKRICEEKGIEPQLLCVSGTRELQFSIEMGRGICLTNVNNNLMYSPTVRCEQFDEFTPAEFGLMWNTSNGNPCVKLFEQVIIECGFPLEGVIRSAQEAKA